MLLAGCVGPAGRRDPAATEFEDDEHVENLEGGGDGGEGASRASAPSQRLRWARVHGMKRRGEEGDGRPAGSRERRSRSGTPWRPRRKVRVVRVLRPGLRELPERILAQLGKLPDRKLAERAGVHPNTIHHERKRRGIPAFVQQREAVRWTRDMIRKLGTATDRSIAAELGIPIGCVSRKRRILGIPPYSGRSGRQPRAYPWSPEDLACLGKVSDRALARALGLSTGTVALKRQMLGIPPWRSRPPAVVWTPAMRRLLGRVSDLEVARRFSISSSTVVLERRRLGIPPVVDRRGIEHPPALLGLLRLPPSEVRRRTGLNPKTIAVLRERYGIRSLRAAELRYTPEVIARMGKESDKAIASDLSCSPTAVLLKRRSLGIPAYQGFRKLPRRRRAGRAGRRS